MKPKEEETEFRMSDEESLSASANEAEGTTSGTIAGFEIGVFGMRAGGERWIIVPPDLGYGDAEQETIPAGSVLIFNVELCTLDGAGPNPDCGN